MLPRGARDDQDVDRRRVGERIVGGDLEPFERGDRLAVRRDREDLACPAWCGSAVCWRTSKGAVELGVVDAVDDQEACPQRAVLGQVGRRAVAPAVGAPSGRRAAPGPAGGRREPVVGEAVAAAAGAAF